MTTQWKLIGRGKCGWHASGTEGGNKVSSSGGTLENYLEESQDGVLVYDAEQADYDAFVDWTYKGPMSNVDLKSGEIHRFLDAKPSIETQVNQDGSIEKVALARLLEVGSHKVGSLDYVALDIYMALFKLAVPGVRFGKVVGHAIQWDA